MPTLDCILIQSGAAWAIARLGHRGVGSLAILTHEARPTRPVRRSATGHGRRFAVRIRSEAAPPYDVRRTCVPDIATAFLSGTGGHSGSLRRAERPPRAPGGSFWSATGARLAGGCPHDGVGYNVSLAETGGDFRTGPLLHRRAPGGHRAGQSVDADGEADEIDLVPWRAATAGFGAPDPGTAAGERLRAEAPSPADKRATRMTGCSMDVNQRNRAVQTKWRGLGIPQDGGGGLPA
jgi:hypothetical protein